MKFCKKYQDTIDIELHLMENDEEPWIAGGYVLVLVNSVPYGTISMNCGDENSLINSLKEAMEIVAPQIYEDAEEAFSNDAISDNDEPNTTGAQ